MCVFERGCQHYPSNTHIDGYHLLKTMMCVGYICKILKWGILALDIFEKYEFFLDSILEPSVKAENLA